MTGKKPAPVLEFSELRPLTHWIVVGRGIVIEGPVPDDHPGPLFRIDTSKTG